MALAAAVVFAGAVARAADAPARVVSVNLCTDQLAMMLAAPGQLIAVTRMAQDPRASAMADVARGLPAVAVNAEDIYLLQPDLVIAGAFTSRATLDMLARLGLRVERFEPAYALHDIPERIARMGAVLGRPDQAAALSAEFDAALTALADPVTGPRAALYYAGGHTSGDGSLAGQILRAAGFSNIAEELGAIAHLPLEVLAMARPDAVITGRPNPGASRAEDVMRHPVVRALQDQAAQASMTDRDWVCGTPHVLAAIARLSDLRQTLEAGP